MRRVLCFLVLLCLATPAIARWHVAESDHFVVYADDRAKDVERFSEYLERYHSALELVTGRKLPAPSPSNRVTIYVVGGQSDIRELAGSDSRYIAGFYLPRASGSVAFVQDIRFTSDYPSFGTVVLLHEYAHHFLISSSRLAMPRWLSEGAAEFFASASFTKEGGIKIGRDAQHRAYELVLADNVGIEELLDPDRYAERRNKGYDDFYGRSWLLYHYLQFSEERKGQIDRYGRAMAEGESSIDAARAAFGDLEQLEKDMERYLTERQRAYLDLPAAMLSPGPVTVRELPEGEAKIMPVVIRSKRGVDAERAGEIVADARKIAASYPDDPGVLTALAEAEFDAGNNEAAIAAADKAIALDPSRKNAYVQKGYALFRMAQDAAEPDAAYASAMKSFSALNKIENDHPLPLIYYYRSYAERGLDPPENARHALERAAQLAPFDKSLWFQVAVMQAGEGKIELAKDSLVPLASDPHGKEQSEQAQRMRQTLDGATEGEPFNLARFLDSPQTEQVAADDTDPDDGATDEDDGAVTGDN